MNETKADYLNTMHQNLNRLGLLFLFILAGLAQSQAQVHQSIPFKLVNNKNVLIRASVNGKDSITLYFDTGASTSLLDKAVANRLGIMPDWSQQVPGAGGTITYQMATAQQVSMNGVSIKGVDMVLDDLTRLRKALGYHFDGIIGYALIRDHVTQLDFDAKQINLYPKGSLPDLAGYTAHDFAFHNGITIPQLNLSIELNNGKSYTGIVFFDSGAGLNLLVNTPFKEKHNLLEGQKVMNSSTNNLSNETLTQYIAIKKLEFCGYTFPEMPISLASDKSGVSAYQGYLGILGAEIINRFNFILDYANKKLYLKPNARYKAAFDFPLSGISLSEDEKGIYIYKVTEDSDAYRQGMRIGDRLRSVNGIKEASLEEYRKMLQKEGETVKLIVENKTGIATYTVRLKRLI